MQTQRFPTKAAEILSGFTSPLFCPTYAILTTLTLTFLSYAPAKAKLMVVLATVAITLAIPMTCIFILYQLKKVKTVSLNDRTDRTVPYIIATLCYIGLGFYLNTAHAPQWLLAFIGGAAAIALVNMAINLKWKISGHSAAMGGMCALIFFVTLRGYLPHPSHWPVIITVLIAGLVMTARLYLRCHTPAQIAAGFFTGATIISLSQILFP